MIAIRKLLVITLLGSPLVASAQDSAEIPGTTPHRPSLGSQFDTVDPLSGSVSINIPLGSVPQKGKLSLSFVLQVRSPGYFPGIIFGGSWPSMYISEPDSSAAPTIDDTNDISVGRISATPIICGGEECYTPPVYWVNVHDLSGNHALFADQSNLSNYYAVDGSGYMYVEDPDPTTGATLYSNSGVRYRNDAHSQTYNLVTMDGDGNTITHDLTPGPNFYTLIDSVGRRIGGRNSSQSTAGCPNLGNPNQAVKSATSFVIPGPNSQDQTFLLCVTTVHYRTDFFGDKTNIPSGQVWTADGPYTEARGSMDLLQSLVLPNGTYWSFLYDGTDSSYTSAAYMTIKTLRAPNGGTISYQYTPTPVSVTRDSYNYINGVTPSPCGLLRLTSRTVDSGNGNPFVWTYQMSGDLWNGNYVETDPEGNDTTITYTNYFNSAFQQPLCDSVETMRSTYQGTWSYYKTPLKSIATQYQWALNPAAGLGLDGPVAVFPTEIDTYLPNGVKTKFDHSNGFAAVLKQPGDGTSPDTIYGGSTYTSFGGNDTITITDINDSVINQTAQMFAFPEGLTTVPWSVIKYGKLTPTDDALSMVAGSEMDLDASGHAHAVLSYLNTGASRDLATGYRTVGTTYNYNSSGFLTSKTDALGNVTTFVPDSTGVQPSQVQQPTINGITHIASVQLDPITGALQQSTDQNGQQAAYTYDVIGRPLDALQPATSVGIPETVARPETKYCYTDTGGAFCSKATSPPFSTYITVKATPDPDLSTLQLLDGFGRPISTSILSDPQGTTTVDTTYDSHGNVLTVSLPYRGARGDFKGEHFTYDALGRKVIAQLADGSIEQWCYNNIKTDSRQNNCSPNISSVGSSNWVDHTEVGGKHTQLTYDIEGRLISVFEPDPTTGTPSLPTFYHYDVLGNLSKVSQGIGASARVRRFKYDSLSRLTESCNPEALPSGELCDGYNWSSAFTYDDNNNLKTKSDARPVVTSYTYDALNRIISKTYQFDPSGTPSSCYQYDAESGTNAQALLVGHLTIAWTQKGGCAPSPPAGAITQTSVLAYDPAGRPANALKKVMHQNFGFSMGYNLSGRLNFWGDGGTTFFEQHFNGSGLPSQITEMPNFGSTENLFTLPTYGPQSDLNSWKLGDHLEVIRTTDSTNGRVTSEVVNRP